MSGHVDELGNVTGTYSYPGYTATTSGQLAIQANGHLGGAVYSYEGGNKVGTSTFDLIKQ